MTILFESVKRLLVDDDLVFLMELFQPLFFELILKISDDMSPAIVIGGGGSGIAIAVGIEELSELLRIVLCGFPNLLLHDRIEQQAIALFVDAICDAWIGERKVIQIGLHEVQCDFLVHGKPKTSNIDVFLCLHKLNEVLDRGDTFFTLRFDGIEWKVVDFVDVAHENGVVPIYLFPIGFETFAVFVETCKFVGIGKLSGEVVGNVRHAVGMCHELQKIKGIFLKSGGVAFDKSNDVVTELRLKERRYLSLSGEGEGLLLNFGNNRINGNLEQTTAIVLRHGDGEERVENGG